MSDRELTAAESKWCNAMIRLMRRKPKGLTLFANGNIHVIDTDQFNNRAERFDGGSCGQPIAGSPTLGPCEGGDF